MSDKEKAIKVLTEIYDEAYDRWVHRPYIEDKLITLIRDSIPDAIALLREQEPRVLTLNEVERIGTNNFGALSSEDLTILWIEELGKNYGIAPVVAKWDEDDWNGEPNDIVRAYYFASDLDEEFNLNEYNRTWRLWTDKPTKTQRMGAAWDA